MKPKETWPEMQRRHTAEKLALVTAAVRYTGGNQTAAAELIDMPGMTVNRLIHECDLDVPLPKNSRKRKAT